MEKSSSRTKPKEDVKIGKIDKSKSQNYSKKEIIDLKFFEKFSCVGFFFKFYGHYV